LQKQCICMTDDENIKQILMADGENIKENLMA
jgi:hypothetical protein